MLLNKKPIDDIAFAFISKAYRNEAPDEKTFIRVIDYATQLFEINDLACHLFTVPSTIFGWLTGELLPFPIAQKAYIAEIYGIVSELKGLHK